MAISNYRWRVEIEAIIRKELKSELRSKSGLLSSGLFSVASVVAISLSGYSEKISGNLGAGLFWVTLLFSATISLPRSFILEEEAGTADLLRLMARPHAVFWGKALSNFAQMVLTGVVLSALFMLFTSLSVESALLYCLSLVGGCAALSVAVTLCGALVAQAANRGVLGAVIGIPILLPMVAMGVGAMRTAFGIGTMAGGYSSCLGLYAFAIVLGAAAPYLYAAVWKG